MPLPIGGYLGIFPEFLQTRKPHSKKMRKIRRTEGSGLDEIQAGKLGTGKGASAMRYWYSEGGAPVRKTGLGGSTPHEVREHTRRADYDLRYGTTDFMPFYGSRVKDSRRYAARLKKRNPKQFNLWFETGRLR